MKIKTVVRTIIALLAVVIALDLGITSNALNPSQSQGGSIRFSTKEITVLIGTKQTLRLELKPANERDIIWSSSNENIVSVDQRGNVKGITLGSVIITAKIAGSQLEDVCIVNVVDKTGASTALNYNIPPSTRLLSFPYSILRADKLININHSDVIISGYGKAWMGLIKSGSSKPTLIKVFVNHKEHKDRGITSYEIGGREDEEYFAKLNDFVSLSIKYDDSKFQDPLKLSIFSYDEKKDRWTKVDSTVDTLEKKVTAKVDRLGEYAVMEYTSSLDKLSKKLTLYFYIALSFIGGIALRHFSAILLGKMTKNN